MKTVSVWLALILVPTLAVAALQQKPAPARGPIAYIVSQRITNETTEGKAGVARIQALQRERSGEARAKQEALETTRRQIAAAQDAAERTRLQTQEYQQRSELERLVAQSQTDLQRLQRQIQADLGTRVKSAIEAIVKETGVQLVVSAETTVVWSAPGLDLTGAVIERLNAPAPAAAPAKP